MAELRSVDPRSLMPNPNNPRRSPTPQAMDDQLTASILAIGVIQPPRVKEIDGALVLIAGHRRTKAAIAANLATIDVHVCDGDETADAMRAISENLVRASMNSVDIWRATEALEGRGWNEQAIADALALPPRTVKRLKLLAHLHPAMLDVMAAGSMPNEEQLRTIAAAGRDEQTQVWKKHKPKKGHEVNWWDVARALAKRRIKFSTAKFGEDLATAYGVTWDDDLFAPAGEDGRYTTNVEGFFGAQQEWMQKTLPERDTILTTTEHGRPTLPKKAQETYGKPNKGDTIGHYVDSHSGEVRTMAYRMPAPAKPLGKNETGPNGDTTDTDDAPPTNVRPDVTMKGNAMIGDIRTNALHQALETRDIDDTTLLALLVLAFAGTNVSVQSAANWANADRDRIAATLTEDGVLTTDPATLQAAACSMLTAVLSCRADMSNSGNVARIAGDAIGASRLLPNMATEEFLSCVSKPAIERAAAAEGVRVEVRGKDTRARMIDRFKDGHYIYPAAHFALSAKEAAAAKALRRWSSVPGTHADPTADANAISGEADPATSSAPAAEDGMEPPRYAEAAD